MTLKIDKIGISTLVTHLNEGNNPYNAHITPIFQTSTFGFDNTSQGASVISGESAGYFYTRIGNPNLDQLAKKIAALEGLDLVLENTATDASQLTAGTIFGSGMAAVTGAVLARVKSGESILAQHALYGATFQFLDTLAPKYGINVIWVEDTSDDGWAKAFQQNKKAKLAYAETPSNPTLSLVDLKMIADMAHQHGAWLMVDNTFATPFCQRPISLGADIVVHSTTKYLSGHGLVIGGAVVSPHIDFIQNDIFEILDIIGSVASPFDAWLTNIGLKTFELRMMRQCDNAAILANYLENHPKIARVFYPGLESHPNHEIAVRQMFHYGAMISFELQGGLESGTRLMNRVDLCSLAVSLGMVDTLIQHPASMTHAHVPSEKRKKMGISDGLVRFSVGIENVEDIIADLDQALDF